MQEAQEILDQLNKENEQILKKVGKSTQRKKIKASDIELKVVRSQDNMKFKIYEDDDLEWPMSSFLIRNSNLIRPKNGDSKRITQEQDYGSDKEVVNSAKQKLKREVKVAIESKN